MKTAPQPWLLAFSLGLSACGDAVPATAFDPHTLPESSGWGQGLEGFGTGGTPGDTGGTGGTSTSQFDGTWEGPYSLLVELTDYAVTCTCSADLTLVVIEGDVQVGFGESCSMTDCGITSQLSFSGGVGADGTAAGDASTSGYVAAAVAFMDVVESWAVPVDAWDTFVSLGYTLTDLVVLTDFKIAAIPTGEDIPYCKNC